MGPFFFAKKLFHTQIVREKQETGQGVFISPSDQLAEFGLKSCQLLGPGLKSWHLLAPGAKSCQLLAPGAKS